MAVPIRTLIFASIIMLSYVYALIGFIGSYSLTNGIPLNATLKTQYEAIVGNSSNLGIGGTLGNLSTQAGSQSNLLGGTGLINDIGTVSTYISSISAVYSATADLVAYPLEAMGFQVSQVTANIALLIVLIIVLGILSAIFLFPI